MVVSCYYVLPNGKTLSLGDFVLFWLREILLLGFIAGVVLYAAVLSLLARIRKRRSHERSAL
jgi:hypothetical protein